MTHQIGDCTLYTGDVLAVLREIPDESVHCVMTSPPYWGLRDYGIEGQIGLEATPEEYVARMVAVFREVRRILRSDGTAWVNMGDSYIGGGRGGLDGCGHGSLEEGRYQAGQRIGQPTGRIAGYKAKDLVGIPWMVAFALRADGWYLRSENIWSKPNPMPESVTDRPTKSHEQLFLLAKGQWKSRVVKFANLPGEHFHLLQNLGSNRKPVGFPAGLAIDFAASIFDLSQLQQNFTLPPFYSEVWQQSANGSDSDFIRCLPVEHRPAVWAARFLTAKATTKEFFGELNRFFVTLPNGDDLLKAWTSTSRFDSPHITGDGEGTVTVHYPGQICKVDLVHGEITISEPKGCVYFYDADAVREDSARPDLFDQTRNVYAQKWNDEDGREYERRKGVAYCNPLGRNRRTVWTIATEQYPEAHFATFPRKLVQPCILAGCPEHACPKCGAPWVREVEAFSTGKRQKMADGWDTGNGAHGTVHRDGRGRGEAGKPVMGSRTIGEHPTCACGLAPIGGTVLDPFGGSGTTAEVALEYGRRAILIELKPEYVELAKRRLDPVAGRPMLDFVGGGNE